MGVILPLTLERGKLLTARLEIGLQLRYLRLQLLLGGIGNSGSILCLLKGSAELLLTRGKLLLVAVEVNFPLRQLALLRRQLLGGKPLLLFNFSLLEEESFPLLGELLALRCQGPESFLPETPELLRALLDIHSHLRDKRFSGFQLVLSGAVKRQQLPQ